MQVQQIEDDPVMEVAEAAVVDHHPLSRVDHLHGVRMLSRSKQEIQYLDVV